MNIIKLFLILLVCQILPAKPYQIVTLDYPPYEYEEQGKVKGIATEIVRETFKRMGEEIEIKLFPWKRSLEMVKNGQADAIFTIYHTKERADFLDYSNEIVMPQRTALFTLNKSAITYSGDLNELKNYSFGVVLGISYGEKFDSFIKNDNLKINSLYDGEANIRGLLTGYSQIIVSNELGARSILKDLNKINEVTMLEPILQDVPSYLAFSKNRKLKKLRDRFDASLKQLKADGTYDIIIKKYLQDRD